MADDEVLAQRLARHNRRWGAALENWYRHAAVAWTPGMIVDHELRIRFDTFFPWAEFSHSLRSLAQAFLPSPAWTPRLLEESAVETALDFWEEVGDFCGRATFRQEELLPFFCACADPPRFGTRAGRYPDQLSSLPRADALLDLGCGIGLGTLEAARQCKATHVVGVTLEPLEAWMANRRTLPHDALRQQEFRRFQDIPAEFLAGEATSYRGKERFALILCNGLAGGRFLKRREQFLELLKTFDTNLQVGGMVALANSFHPGYRKSTEEFLQTAAELGWTVSGNWRNSRLQRQRL